MAKTVCKILGVVFILIGLVGFVSPGFLGTHLRLTRRRIPRRRIPDEGRPGRQGLIARARRPAATLTNSKAARGEVKDFASRRFTSSAVELIRAATAAIEPATMRMRLPAAVVLP